MAPPSSAVDPAVTVDTLVAVVGAMAPVSLTYEQTIAAALWGGFSTDDAVTMAAIASVTTSRNAIAISGKAAGGSRRYGLFAVEQSPTEAIDGVWISPEVNGQRALAQKGKSGWGSWGAYSSGAYLAAIPQATIAGASLQMKLAAQPWANRQIALEHVATPESVTSQTSAAYGTWLGGAVFGPPLSAGGTAIGQLGGATAGATVDSVFKPFGSVLDFLNALGNPQTWVRVATALIGGALIVVALRQVATQ
jgi:hypothetical protein